MNSSNEAQRNRQSSLYYFSAGMATQELWKDQPVPELNSAGKITLVIDWRSPLAEAVDAFDSLEQAHARANVMLAFA